MASKSIYEKVLEEFHQLHPMLQKRYQIRSGDSITAKGTMNRITGGPKWLYPLWIISTRFKLFFPERGEHIPFTITNRAFQTDKGIEKVYWERAFHFPKKIRYFNATMSMDPNHHIIKDYLGDPSLLYSDLNLVVESDGGITIRSVKQRFVIGKLEIPLLKWMYGVATVKETYDEDIEAFTISVHVHNRIIGTVFAYEGVFQIDE